MIEEVQDAIVSIIQTNIGSELESLRSPEGGTALTLTVPAKYLINYDPETTLIPQNSYPAVVQIPGRSDLEDRLQQGHVVIWWHSIALILLFQLQSNRTDALNAIELIQRQRSRYALATVAALKKNQQTDPIQQIKINDIQYTRTLSDDENTVLLGGVWISLMARERVTL